MRNNSIYRISFYPPYYLRFLAIYIFYSLPITIKINLVNLAIKFKIKDILQKWFHFN